MSGIYIEGPNCMPTVLHNVFMVCQCAGITLNTKVEGFVALNEV